MYKCEFCSAIDSQITVKTYKHEWIHCDVCGNYKRLTRSTYPFSWFFDSQFAKKMPKGNALTAALGHKPAGVDYYRYYEDILKSGKERHWAGEYATFKAELAGHSTDLQGLSILDISGEPGFFARDCKEDGLDITVTAFADNVSKAINKYLAVKSFKYDFNADNLAAVSACDKYDIVTVRNAISFCENLPKFFEETAAVLKPGGRIYILFSPPSRSMTLRWMLDDYTYLRLYTAEYIRRTAENSGFRFEWLNYLGKYHWANDIHPVLKAVRLPYLRNPFFRSASDYQMNQHCNSLMMQSR